MVELLCSPTKIESNTIKRNFYRGNYIAIKEDLGSVNWAEMNSLNVQERWDLFMEKITNCMEKHIPVIRYTGKRLKPKWMDGYCVRAVRSKFKSWIQYLRTRNRYDYERYCANRNRATKATIKAKIKFEKNIADSVKDNPKSFWGYVSSKTKARSGVSDLKNENGDLVSSDGDKANILNDFFASVFTREYTRDIPDFDKRYNSIPVTEINVTKDKVLKDLKSLNVSKSMGPDGCHGPLYEIFKKSFEDGEIPKVWKDANVSSIYKNKGSKSSATNYRPVSLTCVPSRLSEKCFCDTILTHMNSNKLFSNCQLFVTLF